MLRPVLLALLLALPLALPLDARERAPRSVNDLRAEHEVTIRPQGAARCFRATTTRVGNQATITVNCRANDAPVTATLEATFFFAQSGEFAGACRQTVRRNRTGPFTLSCSDDVPPPVPLPITFSGSGDTLTGPFTLPGGTLLMTAGVNREGRVLQVEVAFDRSAAVGLRFPFDAGLTEQEVFSNPLTQAARLEIDVEGAGTDWIVIISDPMPD